MSVHELEELFPGHSEMDRLVRSLDWSKTAVGPVETWPQSLRTAVSICLGSRHPIVLWWGPERTMFYNDAYRPMLGESKHPQFFGGSGKECWAEIWDIIGPMMDHVVDTGEATWSEDLFLLMLRYGYPEETYFTFSYSPIRDESGQVGGIFNACAESTARVLGERRLKTLREMAAQSRTADEAARFCIEVLGRNPQDIPFALVYLADDSGESLRLAGHAGLEPGKLASPVHIEMREQTTTGWPLAKVMAQGHPEVVEDLADRFDCLPAEPWEEPAHQAMVLPILHPGRKLPAGVLVLGISPRRAFDDAYHGFFDLVSGHIATAVSNARAFEEERRRAEALAELDRAKTAFFSNVSHEFRTPLTLILGPLADELAEHVDVLPQRRHERIEAAHRNALRLLKLVNTLLDFARIEAGRMEAVYEPTDLARLTAELAGNFHSACESAGLYLHVDCPPLPDAVYVDRQMWEKIVLNLLSNAFKFTLAGGITVSIRPAEEKVELSVRDSGIGIPADDLPHIFERFHRVKGAQGRTHEGTGIGLSLIRELVLFHGGSIAIESVLGVGSTFTVTIPQGSAHLKPELVGSDRTLVSTALGAGPYVEEAKSWLPAAAASATEDYELRPEHVQASTSQPSDPRHDTQAISGARPRILWADDNADMRDYVRRLLADRFDVEAVADGLEALAATRRQMPDLVLSDVMMPRLDGFGLLRELRADERTRTLPVILLSARAGEEARVQGLTAGADDYLVKPFSARELLAVVGAQIEMARMRREAEERLRQAHKMEALGTLTGGIAHDFNNILAAIIGFTELVAGHADIGSRDERHLARVMEAGIRGREVVRQLLTFLRKTEQEKKPLRLSGIVGETVKLIRATTPATINIRVNTLSESGLILGDPTQLRQVLMNLCTNASYAMREKGGNLDIELSDFSVSSPNGDPHGISPGLYMRLVVRDTGTGISPDIMNKIFDPFFTTKKVGEGSGLGLSVVHGIVKQHDGYITVESEPARGSTFTVYLPRVAGELRTDAVKDDEIPTGSERILFVDDEEALVQMGEDILAELGYEVTSRMNGHEALALIQSDPSRFDLVVTDQTMPEMTGIELAKEVLAVRPDMPIIMCTGFSYAVDADKAGAAGIKAFAMKPLTKREMALTIRKALDG